VDLYCNLIWTLTLHPYTKFFCFLLQFARSMQGLSHDRLLQVQHRPFRPALAVGPQGGLLVLPEQNAVQLDTESTREKFKMRRKGRGKNGFKMIQKHCRVVRQFKSDLFRDWTSQQVLTENNHSISLKVLPTSVFAPFEKKMPRHWEEKIAICCDFIC